MSVSHDNPGAPTGQPKSAALTKASSLRLSLGVVSRKDLRAVMQVSDHTIKLWVSRGLKAFRPGTKDHLFLLAEVKEFLQRRETFAGKKSKSKRPRK